MYSFMEDDTFKMLLFHYMDKGKSLVLPKWLAFLAWGSHPNLLVMHPSTDDEAWCWLKHILCSEGLTISRQFITIHWLFMNDNHRLLWPVTTHGSGEVNCKYSFNMLLVVPICSSGYEGHHSPITYKPWNGKQASHIRQHIIQPPNSKSDST